MLFNSVHFFFFFIVVTLLYFWLPYQRRWLWLLLASCYFYMVAVPVYILILFFTIVIDYYAGILIEEAQGNRKRQFLLLSLLANIGVLVVFKYYNFLNSNLDLAFSLFGSQNPVPYLNIILPIGLSFHTFQAMSYTIEVYRGHQEAERHFGIYALYVMFYPQLVAGPIERPQNLLFQFRKKFDFDYGRVTSGLRLMAWGLFKKVLIADRLAILVDKVYNHPDQFQSLALIIATVFFSFQIFCDFSGYSDMAIGAARVMGFTLMTNFKSPYRAATISEFWKRWHISLSTWFKDYLYISLGGNRVSVPRWYLNLFIVFLVSGIWHGANWTFVIWGALHGFYLVFGLITARFRNQVVQSLGLYKIPLLNQVSNFILIAFAWIFFRAENLTVAMDIILGIFKGFPALVKQLLSGYIPLQYMGLTPLQLVFSFALILFLELVHYWEEVKPAMVNLVQWPVWRRWVVYYALILAIVFFGVFEDRQFIYFQF